MFSQINVEQTLVMVKCLMKDHQTEDGVLISAKSMEAALEEMELVNDLLTLMKSKMLLNKKRGLKRAISQRIEMSLPNSRVISGSSNIHFGDI